MADDNTSNLLVVIFDVNPVWWGRYEAEGIENEMAFTRCIDSLMAFCNAHLMMKYTNTLAFIACHTSSSQFLYPRQNEISEEAAKARSESSDGKYEQFAEMNDTIAEELRNLINNTSTEGLANDASCPSLLSGALSMALCFIHRAEKECLVGLKLKPRILVVQSSPDVSSQYMAIMNCIFAAQKNNIVIDTCVLERESGFLQQACDITGGIYIKIPQLPALLQYLMWIFLPDPPLREKLVLPTSTQVDYRAACFCHRRLVDIGFVCSVCLSIYCQFTPRCLTCQTRFKLPAPPMIRNKKKKKERT